MRKAYAALAIMGLAAGGGFLGRSLEPASSPQRVAGFGQLPLAFEPNRGQAAEGTEFLVRGRGYDLQLKQDAVVLHLREHSPATIALSLAGAVERPAIAGERPLPGKVHYLVGDDPARHRTHIPTYGQVRYQAVYPGVDWVLYGNPGQLEYDFVVQPGADPAQIRLRYAGAESLRVNAAGELVLQLRDGEVVQKRPIVYQDIGGERRSIDGRYRIGADRTVGFELAAYDAGQVLTIDPVLEYSTYLGGTRDDRAAAIAVDGAGSAYVAGYTLSADFNTVDPLEPDADGDASAEAFIAKLSPDGSSLVYATYLGGANGDDYARGIAVDPEGSAYVAGYTLSTDFNTVGAIEGDGDGNQADAFVAKLSPAGDQLVYSTYLGGSSGDHGMGIAVAGDGSALVTGSTLSSDFDTVNPAEPDRGVADAFVARLAPSGDSLVYSTYLGGSAVDEGHGIAVDALGNAYVAGYTQSNDFEPGGSIDPCVPSSAFVTKLGPDGTQLYSACLNASLAGSNNSATSVAVDGDGSAYVAGSTFRNTGGFTAFVAKLDPAGNSLVYTRALGGGLFDEASAVAVDDAGNAWVAGRTLSTDFDSRNPLPGEGDSPGSDAFVASFDALGRLAYATYLGGNGDDAASAIAVDDAGAAYVAGYTLSTDFDTANAIEFDTVEGTSSGTPADAFIAKLVAGGVAAGTLQFAAAAVTVGESDGSVTVTIRRVGGSTGAVSVDYQVGPDSAGNDDFTVSSGVLSFADGESSRDLIVPVSGDTRDEADERFRVILSDPTGGAILGSASVALVTIVDDDTAGSLQFDPIAYTVNEAAGSAALTVRRIGGSDGPLGANFETLAGTAAEGQDYQRVTGAINWAHGEAGPKSIAVPIVDDAVAEPQQEFSVSLFNVLGTLGSATVEIVDNDAAYGLLQFSADAYSFEESAGTATLTVTRSGGSAGAVSVAYATVPGTASRPGDFGGVSNGVVSWTAGDDAPKTITVPIVDDDAAEPDESFGVTLSNPGGGAGLGAPLSATVTLLASDNQRGVLQFAATGVAVGESAGSVSLSVMRVQGSDGAVTVNYAIDGGSAVAGQDFANTPAGQLSWAAGDSAAKTITIPIVDDAAQEADESFSVSLSLPGGGAALGTPSTAAITITDDDGAGAGGSGGGATDAPALLLLAALSALGALLRRRPRVLA